MIVPVEIGKSIYSNSELILTITKQEIVARYRGSFLGLIWTFITPLLLLAMYTFVFSEVLGARWNNQIGTKMDYTMILYLGLIIHSFFADCLISAQNSIKSKPNYVKKIPFPLEILPIICVLTASFQLIVNFIIWLLAYIILLGPPQFTIFLLPLALIPFLLLTIGICWMLAALSVFVQDIQHAVNLTITGLLFLSPVFYPISAIPEQLALVVLANPITIVIESVRDVAFWGTIPDLEFLLWYSIVALLILILGFSWFQKTRDGFSDVL